MNAIDTNVLFYAHDPRDGEKQIAAIELIRNLDVGVLLWQVACEYLAASRKLAPLGYRLEDARADLRDLLLTWELILPTWAVLDLAVDVAAKHSISYWDALLVAAASEARVTRMYSEDLAGRPGIRGVEFVNPFASPA